MRVFQNLDVKAKFESYPKEIQDKLLFLRELIFDVAEENTEVGALEECLRWNEVSYLTSESKSGSMIRINQYKKSDSDFALYFHCQTTLVDSFKEIHGDLFRYEGNRAVIFNPQEIFPIDAIKHCIQSALLYHLRKA